MPYKVSGESLAVALTALNLSKPECVESAEAYMKPCLEDNDQYTAEERRKVIEAIDIAITHAECERTEFAGKVIDVMLAARGKIVRERPTADIPEAVRASNGLLVHAAAHVGAGISKADRRPMAEEPSLIPLQ